MSYLRGADPSANEAVWVNMDKVTSFFVSGGGSTFVISASITGASAVLIKDGYTSKAQAELALTTFLADIGIEEIS